MRGWAIKVSEEGWNPMGLDDGETTYGYDQIETLRDEHGAVATLERWRNPRNPELSILWHRYVEDGHTWRGERSPKSAAETAAEAMAFLRGEADHYFGPWGHDDLRSSGITYAGEAARAILEPVWKIRLEIEALPRIAWVDDHGYAPHRLVYHPVYGWWTVGRRCFRRGVLQHRERGRLIRAKLYREEPTHVVRCGRVRRLSDDAELGRVSKSFEKANITAMVEENGKLRPCRLAPYPESLPEPPSE